ncbi:hypothetical protein CK203_105704 [Vitis vinifera]|uniref:Uncharacterized protein n=1 Tax=Vitis vinifera TaxID=29760 RepID=A0A438BPI9_VITVI|nr:hypothetical protein CK203_105704 [Vitis vinifera]
MTFNIPLFFINTGHLSCERVSERENAIATVCSSPCPSPTTHDPPVILPVITSGQISSVRYGANQRSQIFLSFQPQSSPREAPFKPILNLRDQKLLPPAKPARSNPPARRYLTGQGAVPAKESQGRKLRAHRLNRAVPVPSPEPSPAHLRRRLRASAEPQEHQPPLSEPQIHLDSS